MRWAMRFTTPSQSAPSPASAMEARGRDLSRRERAGKAGREPPDRGELLAASIRLAHCRLRAVGETPGDRAGADASRDDDKKDGDVAPACTRDAQGHVHHERK